MMSQESLERSYPVEKSPSVHLTNIRGSVDIQPGEEGVITITAVKHPDTGNSEKTLIEINQENNHKVTVKTRFSEKTLGFIGHGKPCMVDYSLRVPRSCTLKLNCVSSAASIHDLEGEFSLNTVSGPINLSKLSGFLDIRSVSGKITGDSLSGPLRTDTVSGKVQANNSHFSETNCQTVSGHINLQTPLSEGPYRFKSVSGHVTLIVPGDVSFSATLKSMSGQLKSKLPDSKNSRSGGVWHAEVGGGGPEIDAKSMSGHLVLLTTEFKMADAEVIPTSQTERADESANGSGKAMGTLERIESGELTVSEALEELGS
jgi:DUF4097 and DUF4098 domain-containing protein YvlB